ncbi:M81 family metallopeptidase [Reyranella sp.]|uniref:M81 family metallopeptidase n=1 Tax=Reyranella sp. TaxID=1929291 RepID=UPI000BDC7810|nr:M81 family metallopeptidase [Reyranella sp.]OYY37634.1 MAG: MlrC family protein 3 [Rhodospirillales bacterium 35-66-84]OYZ92679.1 MAG: MlrC family protein 3 [Rhodospirillales bacterium 24-66-33]OZB24041.1 MAG: MlrC family protein 3 [Rhodospirillales bacterium 39-66-50]HQS17392.1 M81 family metallopeptidase [Reyranella sp.]HQT13881.1 M81 family metallopeptidase [Reyranella sp.]
MSQDNPRIAVLGFAIECNRFAPVTTAEDFEHDVDIRGNRIVSEARSGKSITMPDLPGFFTEMDRTGNWTPVPLRVSLAQPGGPVEEQFFKAYLAEIESGLKSVLPVDAIFVSCHGAALAEGTDDPDGDLFEMLRRVTGPDVPIVSVFDLHANVSRRMTDNLSVFVGYLENPHVDIYERGVEAAKHMRELLAGTRTAVEMVKIPLVPPQIALLTARGPYADLIKYGQTKVGGDILNVSVMAGFAYSDSPKNGLTAVVTARNGNRKAAGDLALDIAQRAWGTRERFKREMMNLADAVQHATAIGRDKRRKPIILADVADNPGGGGRGNTTYLLRALKAARAQGVYFGVFNDAALAAQAHALGEGAIFNASFNTQEHQEFSLPFDCEAKVVKLSDGQYVGRRGVLKNVSADMGPSALLDLGGILIVVISIRCQCMDPRQFEMFGLDIAQARTVVVKSRGHFRGGFDEFFKPEQIYEVDCPGLTSPVLANFTWTKLPRPVYPLDEETSWTPPAIN